MARLFNTSGPCDPRFHYMLPVLRRLPEVRGLIDQRAYFVLHAPRQMGKTTSLLALAGELTAEGRYAAILLSAEVGAPFAGDTNAAEAAILDASRGRASNRLPIELLPPPWPEAPPGRRIGAALSAWARACPRPLVVFFDEIDALADGTLVSVLRQLRDGFADRPEAFPSSLALVGLRDVQDYKVAAGGSGRLGSSSPFNIKAESITLRNFNREEVAELYEQHTSDTGQVFLPEAVDRAFYWTQGQPWLVNALARQLVEKLVPDSTRSITAKDVDVAKEILIARRDTHLDSLAERLREERVRRIVEPILAGLSMPDVAEDDIRFVLDLGLLKMSETGGLEAANPIYREVIPRVLAFTPQASLPMIAPSWLSSAGDGRLDPTRLLDAFLVFWRQHGEPLMKSAPYHEIAPHLVLMAFLHRVVNGGGTIDREYAIGSGRMDLCVRHRDMTLAIEIKVWRDGEPDPVEEGLSQLDGYLAGLSRDSGWLVIFDRRSGQPRIAQRTSTEQRSTPSGREVTLIRA